MSAIDRVRIMVLGDSGVGKTSFVHLAAYGEPLKSPSWTVGCSVEVKLHEYKEGTPEQTTYFIEFWDVGGSNNHRNTRQVFYVIFKFLIKLCLKRCFSIMTILNKF